MTRDDAIEAIIKAIEEEVSPQVTRVPFNPEPFVDALAALGVLKLKEAGSIIHPGPPLSRKQVSAIFDEKGMPRQHVYAPIPDVMSPAPARCEPPPEHREKRWHWLSNSLHDGLVPHRWTKWGWSVQVCYAAPDVMGSAGWRYVAPCEEPKP